MSNQATNSLEVAVFCNANICFLQAVHPEAETILAETGNETLSEFRYLSAMKGNESGIGVKT
jgi:hypothetical protein